METSRNRLTIISFLKIIEELFITNGDTLSKFKRFETKNGQVRTCKSLRILTSQSNLLSFLIASADHLANKAGNGT